MRCSARRLIRLSRIPLAYAPPAEMPDVGPLPALANGCITFGYFGRTVRLNDTVLAVWARILQAIPGLRLMLNSAPFSEPAGREQMLARFAALGIERGAARSCLHVAAAAHLGRVWRDRHCARPLSAQCRHHDDRGAVAGRAGAVALRPADGRPVRRTQSCMRSGWMTGSAAIPMPMSRAPSQPRPISRALARLRAGLRPRFAASPLRDAAGLAREVEVAYRNLWRRWCEADTQDVRQLYKTGDTAGAHRLAERRLAGDPRDAAALHVLGLIRFGQGDAATAVDSLQRSVDSTPDAGVCSDLGVVLRSTGRLAEAESSLSSRPATRSIAGAGARQSWQRAARSAPCERGGGGTVRGASPHARSAMAVAKPGAQPDGSRRGGSRRGCSAAGPGDRSRGCRGARHARCFARAVRAPDRGGGASSCRPAARDAAPPCALQSGDRAADAKPTCRGRPMLPRGARGTAGLCRRARQSAVHAQLPQRPVGRSDIRRIPQLGSSGCR